MQLAAQFSRLAVAQVAATRPSFNASTLASREFSTFLVNMPFATTFSQDAEVQVILASVPLIAAGVLGVGLAMFQLAMARMNRTFLNLFLAFATVFAAGILELANVLRSELRGFSFLTRELLVASGIALSAFVSFKFFFLEKRIQQPGLREVLQTEGTTEEKSRRRRSWRGDAKSTAVIHSGSYARWGMMGEFLRVGVYLSILAVTLMEGVWRVGFSLATFRQFIPVYIASHVIQIVLLAFFAIKLVVSTAAVKSEPLVMNYVDILPTLFGIAIAIGVAALNLVPGLTGFSATPLGRFLILVEMFAFVVSMTIQDCQRPYSDDFSFHRPRNSFASSLAGPRHPRDSSMVGSDTQLPERIVIWKTSRPPSWFTGKRRGTEQESLAAGAMPPGRSTGRIDIESQQPMDAYDMYFDEGPHDLQGSEIRFRGLARGSASGSFPTSARPTHSVFNGSDYGETTRIVFQGGTPTYIVPSPGSLIDPFRSPPPRTRALPALPAPAKRASWNAPTASFYSRRTSAQSGPPPQRTPPPSSMPIPPIPVSPTYFRQLAETSAPTPSSPLRNQPRQSLWDHLHPSPRQSETSDVSLSRFPPPPDTDDELPATKPPTSMTTSGGLRFDLYPSRPEITGGRFDITSMIVGPSTPPPPPRKGSLASTVGSPFLNDEVGVIKRAERATPSLSRNGSIDPVTRQYTPFLPSPVAKPVISPSSSSSSTAYDPAKPFERPRPAPIVFGRPHVPGSVVVFASDSGKSETLRKGGGAGKKIVLVRDQIVE